MKNYFLVVGQGVVGTLPRKWTSGGGGGPQTHLNDLPVLDSLSLSKPLSRLELNTPGGFFAWV